ncbi:MAG: DUF2283 domain-containing protein [Chloroflexota bacterium]
MNMQSFGLMDMQLRIDPDARTLYIVLGHSGEMAMESRELDERRTLEYDLKGDLVGVEFIDIDEGIDLDGVPAASRIARALGIMRAVEWTWSEGGN